MNKLMLLFSFFTLFCGFFSSAQNETFELRQSHRSGIYSKGEKMQVYAFVYNRTNDSLKVSVRRNNEHIISKKGFVAEADSLLIYEGSSQEPASFIVEASLKGQNKGIGMIVDPHKIKPGTKMPKGFKSYWEKERDQLSALPFEVKFGKNESKDVHLVCFDTEINCTGPRPARSYFAKPLKAAPQSLPIVLVMHAAGVKGWWCKSKPEEALRYAKMGKGALCFDLNAHGMLNGQPDEYYNDLEEGLLKDYKFQGLEDRDQFYFRGMYLRLMRTIDFATSLPEWDGKRILIIGESQGGGQALAAAGLDPRVSAVVATVPAMCDWGGTLVDRKGGWPQPFEQSASKKKMKKVLPYFDVAHLLRNSKATIVTEIGLIDQACPSTSVYAALNQAKGKVIIYPVPYRDHGGPSKTDRARHWDKNVLAPKNAFIDDFLK